MSATQFRKTTCRVKDDCTLYITVKGSKLPYHITERHLLQHFKAFESSIINIEIIKKKEKRYAFIKFNSAEMATAAMQALQESLLDNTYLLTINYGQKTVPGLVQPGPTLSLSPLMTPVSPTTAECDSQIGEPGRSIQLYRSLGSAKNDYVLFVRVRNSKFPDHIGDSDLRNHFAKFNCHIVDAFISRNPTTNESSGYGFVAFSSHEAAKNAMRELQGSKLHGRFSLYIRFDGLRCIQHLKPDDKKEEPLEITFEKQLYLKHCFFASPTPLSTALQRSLPVKVYLKGEFIMLQGTNSNILQATTLINTNPLISNLISATHSETWTIQFIGFLEDKFLKQINQTRKDVVCLVRKTPGQEGLEQGSILFSVYVFSHDHVLLQTTVKEIKELKPQSKMFQLRPEHPTVLQIHEAFVSLGEKYCTKIVKESGHGVSIHGLRSGDIQNCWAELKQFIDNAVIVTINVDLGFWMTKYLQTKQCEFVKQEELSGCRIKFPPLFTRPQSLNETVNVELMGKLAPTKKTTDKIKKLCSGIVVKNIGLSCKGKYINIWRHRWEEFITEQDQAGLLVDLNMAHISRDLVVVDITIVGDNPTNVLKAHNDVINKENGCIDRLSKCEVLLNAREFTVLHDNLKMCQTEIETTYFVVVELETEPIQKVTLLAHSVNECGLETARTALTKLVASLTPKPPAVTVRELSCKDDIIQALFVMSKSKYFIQLKQVADQHSVEILPVRDAQIIRLSGIEENVKKVENTFDGLVVHISRATEYAQLCISEHHYPILSTDSFKTVLCTIQREIHVVSSHQCTKKLLRRVQLKCQDDQSIMLKVLIGSLAGEAVDAIVVPAGTQDPTMTNTEMTEKYDKHIHLHNTTLKTGDVHCLSSGSFPSKVAFHVVLPTTENQKDYVLACWSCILQAISKDVKSLSFPLLGVDNKHHLSVTFCATTLFACINHLCTRSKIMSIDTINIVITDDRDAETFVHCFDTCKFTSQTPTVMAKVQPTRTWYWYNDKRQYSEYPKDIANKLTETRNGNPIGMCYFEVGGRHYAIDLSRMIQMNLKTGHSRKILCKESCLKKEPQVKVGLASDTQNMANKLRSPVTVQWYYKDDGHIFVSYSSQDSSKIEAMFQDKTCMEDLVIGSRTYRFDFVRMKQINSLSSFERDIEREEMSLNQQSINAGNISCESASAVTLPVTEYYLTIRGLKVNLQDAKERITEALKDMCTSKVVQVPVSSTHELVQKLMSIAKNHHVKSHVGQAACLNPKCYDRGCIAIEGEEHLVHKAVTELQEEIIRYQSQTVSVSYPPEWEPFSCTTVTTQLFELSTESVEWKHVAQMFRDTVPDSEAVLVSIKRIQNKWLWERYTQTKKRMYQKNSGETNEKDLWHGSRTSADDIYSSEEGFDMRFSSEGMWGRANYFATNASYSVKYAHSRCDNTKELFLAKVLTGNSFESPPNKTLSMPPEKPATSNSEIKLKQVRYDSVNGVTRNCRVYMTYSNDKAYPAYLVQFSMTQKLSPFSTAHKHVSPVPLTHFGLLPRKFI